MKKKLKIIIGGILISGAVLLTAYNYISLRETQKKHSFEGAATVTFNSFLDSFNEGEIKDIYIDFGAEKFNFITQDGRAYETDNPKYSEFKRDLLREDVEIHTIQPKNMNLVFSILQLSLSVGLLFFFYRVARPQIGEKKSALVANRPHIGFADVAGLDESKADISHLVQFLKNPKKYQEIGAKLPKGVVLYGPPGTGKTLIAKAVAGEANVPFFSVSGSDFVEMYVGLGARRVRQLFSDARKQAPCIIFIDEIDAVGSKRVAGPGQGEGNQTINALLAEMDGFTTKDGIIVIAATNRIEDLDPALVRPGRFDRHVAINLPDLEGRRAILKLHAQGKPLSDDVNLDDLAKMTIGFSGAALEMLMNEAAIHAVNNGSSIIQMAHMDEAYYKTIMKGSKKKRDERTSKDEVRLIAYHEAGHALAAKLLTENEVPRVTIIPSTSGAGGATFNIPKKMTLWTKSEILANVKVLYAGRAAEELLTKSAELVTTGASSDIAQATKYLMAYYEQFGFSEEYGMLNLERIAGQGAYLRDAKKLSDELYEDTRAFLWTHWTTVEKIAEALLEKETLTGEELDVLLV